jgi:uncharacterized membrane protein YccC
METRRHIKADQRLRRSRGSDHAATTEGTPAARRWKARASALLADLLVFDPARFAWRLGLRTTIAMVPVLILGRIFHLPELYLVGLAAFLLALGDVADNGDPLRVSRLVIGAGLGGVALSTGVLAGASLPLAILGTMIWGLLAGLMGVYGNASMMMGLPVIWAFAEVGLSIPNHSLGSAIVIGAMYTSGGGIIVILTWLIRIIGPHSPLKRQTAICFGSTAVYLAGHCVETDANMISPETKVRSQINEARQVAEASRRGSRAGDKVVEREIALIEIADRVFSLTVALRDQTSQRESRSEPGMASVLPSYAAVAHEIAAVLGGSARRERLRDALTRLEDPACRATTSIEQSIVAELTQALRILLGDAIPHPASSHGDLAAVPRQPPFAPLLACLRRNSLVGRHALRFAIVTSAAVLCFWYFPKPFGYWIPLTVTVVLRPYAGVTLTRTVQRIIGTSAGILFSSTLMPLPTLPGAQLAFVGASFFCMMAIMSFNYSLAIFFLSAGLIPLEHFINPDLVTDVALMRLAATAIGATLAILGGHLLWPTFERDTIPTLLRRNIRSICRHANRVLTSDRSAAALAAIESTRYEAELDTTNLQAAIHHSISEIGGDAAKRHAAVIASGALQRVMNALSAATIEAQDTTMTRARLLAIVRDLAPELRRLDADSGELIAAFTASTDVYKKRDDPAS